MTETDWIEVTKCKRLAVIKEEQLLEIRKKRYEQLLLDVSNKLERRTDASGYVHYIMCTDSYMYM